jgi:hypothetical protein
VSEKETGLTLTEVERDLYFLGSEESIELIDELLIENQNTMSVLQTVVFRGNRIIYHCEYFEIKNEVSLVILPLIKRLVGVITVSYNVSIKNEKDSPIKLPSAFKDTETAKAFYYLNDNWELNKDIKYAYLYEFMVTMKNFKFHSKSEYENFVRDKFKVRSKVQYDKTTSSKHFERLEKLLVSFNQNKPT